MTEVLKDIKKLHFVGIGGIGMSGIAKIMQGEGYIIQGSDVMESNNTFTLSSMGIKIFIGHEKENITNAECLVVSSIILDDNVEVVEARKTGIPVLKRSEALAYLMKNKTTISISGSHGKTTTTSLVATLFENSKIYPTVINGGIINSKGTNAYFGKSKYLIAEADESDKTFLRIPSNIVVITNIDMEHLDFYKIFDNILESFTNFILNIPEEGFAVVCLDCVNCIKILDKISTRKIITYSCINSNANIFAFNIKCDYEKSVFDVKINLPGENKKEIVENVIISIPGEHNVLNSLAAIAVGSELNFDNYFIKTAFENFKGVKRRFTKVGEYNGAVIIDDYAHHPTEIKSVINTAKLFTSKNNSKIIIFYQPRGFFGFECLYEKYLTAFCDVDYLFMLPITTWSLKKRIENLRFSSENFVREILHPNAFYIETVDEIEKTIKLHAKKSDVVLFLGTGMISKICESVFEKLNS